MPVLCGECGTEHANLEVFDHSCGRNCSGGLPIAQHEHDTRVWHICAGGSRRLVCVPPAARGGAPGGDHTLAVCPRCHVTRGEALARTAATLLRANVPRNTVVWRRPTVAWAARQSRLFMAIIRGAAGRPTAEDAAVERVCDGDGRFAAVVADVRERVDARAAREVVAGWDGVSYLDAEVQEATIYGRVGEAEASWRTMAAVELLAARLLPAPARGGAGGGNGGGGDAGGDGEDSAANGDDEGTGGGDDQNNVPRAVRRVDALRWPDGVNFDVTEEEFEILRRKPIPRPWVRKRDRLLFGELTVRAMHAAADGTGESMRRLMALPRLALGDREKVGARCTALLAGGERARAAVRAAVTAAESTGSGSYDPIERAEALAKMGQAVDAIRVAFDAGAEEIPEAELQWAHNVLEAGAEHEPRAPPRGEMVISEEEYVRLAGVMLPADRPEVEEALMERVRGLAPVSEANLVVDWNAELRALRPGRAAGFDGWRNEMILSLMGAGRDMANRVTAAVAQLARAVCDGALDLEAKRLFAGARLVFIPKTDLTPRPLGVAGSLRRLIARAVVRAAVPGITGWLTTRGQFGVGAAAGTEALARAAQDAYDAGKGVMLIDRRNAYGLLHPEPAAAALRALLPSLRGLVDTLLGVATDVVGPHVSATFRGLYMGCPLSPLAYAVATELGLDAVRPQLAAIGVTSLGYLDDGVLVAEDRDALAQGYRLVEEAGVAWGQRVNARKTKILAREGAQFVGTVADVEVVDYATLVGVPTGRRERRVEECEKLVVDATHARRRVQHRLPRQAAYYLLRAADGLPRLVHMLRAVPPELTAGAAAAHDAGVEADMARLAGADGPEEFGPLRPATFLPLRLGGRATASATLTAGAAYAAATCQIKRINEVPTLRPSGRPPPPHFDTPDACKGPAHCRMPRHAGCATGYCAPCCVALGGCATCDAFVAVRRATDEVRELLATEGLVDGLRRSAVRVGAPEERIIAAFVAATEYRAPQRAVTCALLGVLCSKLRQDLTREHPRELAVWKAVASPTAYAVWLMAPTASSMTDTVVTLALRRVYGLPILSATSLKCVTAAGREGKTCPLRGVVRGGNADEVQEYAARHPRMADQHALACKCGGGAIHTHDDVVHTCAQVAQSWGITVRTEDPRHLPPNCRMDVCVPLAGDAGTGGLAVDFTRRCDASRVDLRRAEAHKEAKYTARYSVQMTVRGAAFSDYGVLGPHAVEVVDRLVAQGVLTTGSHPVDLRAELVGRIGEAVLKGNAAQFAHFAKLNRDQAPWAQPAALVRSGMQLATGVARGLHGWQQASRRARAPGGGGAARAPRGMVVAGAAAAGGAPGAGGDDGAAALGAVEAMEGDHPPGVPAGVGERADDADEGGGPAGDADGGGAHLAGAQDDAEEGGDGGGGGSGAEESGRGDGGDGEDGGAGQVGGARAPGSEADDDDELFLTPLQRRLRAAGRQRQRREAESSLSGAEAAPVRGRGMGGRRGRRAGGGQ